MLSSPALDVRNRTEGSAVSVAFVIEAVLIIGGNVLIIAFFALEKKERKKSFYLVFNMAFADVLLGAVSPCRLCSLTYRSDLTISFGDQMHIEMSLRVSGASVIQF